MRESILEEIEDQRGLSYRGRGARPYRWIRALTTFGVFTPDIDRLWTVWWLNDTVGRAIGTVQYVSCLMYPANENPVFAPWTPDGGGGPPCLWEFSGHLYSHRWMETNLRFLRETLHVESVGRALARAVARLEGQPEHEKAAEVLSDLPLCVDILAARCEELPRLLEKTQVGGRLLEWTR